MAPRQQGSGLRRFRRAIPIALAFVLAMGTVAFADELRVDGDNLVPYGSTLVFGAVDCGVAKTLDARMTIERTTNGNPNIFKDGSTATITVLSVTGAGLSAVLPTAPGDEITFPSGWESTANNAGSTTGLVTSAVTINSTTPGAGSGSVTYRATGTNANGAAMTRTATLNVTWTTGACAPANTAPTVTVTGVTDGATYEFGSVPVAGCSVTDTEDGNSSFAATLSVISGALAAYGLGEQTATCSHTDTGGLPGNASAVYTIVDTGDPIITDLGPTPSSPNGSNGWYVSAVTNSFRADDGAGAGFVGHSSPYEFDVSSNAAEGSAVKVSSGDVSDVAGNTASSIDSAAFKIDLSDPTEVSFVGGPAADSSHYFGSVPAAPTCTANDAISGLASCEVTGYSSAVGTHTMTATATDNAGRMATATSSYTVLAWTIGGFYQPVDMGKLNTAKAGSTIPLKFEVFAGASELTDTAIVKTFTQKMSCIDSGQTDAIEEYATGNTSLRYDTTGGQFIFNWKTPTAKGCYRVTLETQDGTTIKADFQLR
ncbi:MAG: PxKF domain-containing protein [Acidimicrobiia bacterium]